MNILSTESFSSSGAYLTSSRAGPSRCAIWKGNLSAAGAEGIRLRASSIQSCSSQERPVNALRVRFGGAATVTLIDCWLRFKMSTISSRRASLSSPVTRSSRGVNILYRLSWELSSSNPTSDTTCEQVERQVFVHSTRLLSMYTALRGRPAPIIIQPRTPWWTRRQLQANPFLRPLVIIIMGYNYWVPILVLTGRWPRANCASAVVQLDQLGVALYLSALW